MANASRSMVEKLRCRGSNLLLAKAMGVLLPVTELIRFRPRMRQSVK